MRVPMAVAVGMLGRFWLEGDGRLVDGAALPGRQGRLALAYLTLARRPVGRDELAALLWPGALPRSWEASVSAVISKLKKPLATVGLGDALVGALGCYELKLPVDARVDVEDAARYIEDAEAARRAGDLASCLACADTTANIARRPFLPGEGGPWVEERRATLRVMLVRALDLLVAGLVERGGYEADALRQADEVVRLEPFRESGYLALMRLHIAMGNRAQALRVYEMCRRLFAEELGTTPSQELEAAFVEALR